MTNAVLVADDFTGAMDTGHAFAARDRAVRVALRDPTAEETLETVPDILAVDANTRDTDPKTAAETVSRLFDDAPTDALAYKKIDSTMRGNVVAEVDAAVAATGADVAVVAPAFPSTGRLTVNGLHLVDGIPLSDAGYGVSTSDLRTAFDASRYEVRSIGLETVLEGPAAVRSALTDAVDADSGSCSGLEPAIVVCDAAHDRHLEAIATGADRFDGDVLYVGSGGLASAVTVPGTPTEPTSELPTEDGALGVVGSVNERTLEQLAAVPDEFVYRLDPTATVEAPERTGREAAGDLAARLEAHDRAVVTGARSAADVEKAESAAGGRDVHAGDRVATALAAAAAETTADASLAGLFLTGGSVARAVLDELSTSAIDLTGDAIDEGVPVGRIADGDIAGAGVVTKAGGFGSEGSIVNCLRYLSTANDSA